jgi:hypothetical protein
MHTSTEKYTVRITERTIISGFEVERYQYLDKPILRNYKRKERKKKTNDENEKKEQQEKVEQMEKAESSVRRTRREIRRLVNANPQLIKFLTLTTTSVDIAKMNRQFNLFTQRMKDRFSEFQYLAVNERQKDIDHFGKVKPDGGAVHYHLLCNLRYVKSDILAKVWKHGFIKINQVSHVDNLGRYLSKYLQKEMFDKRMFGKKKFFCSQDLKRPIEIINDESKLFNQENSKNLEKKWEPEKPFENDYQGKIQYTLFNFKKHIS